MSCHKEGGKLPTTMPTPDLDRELNKQFNKQENLHIGLVLGAAWQVDLHIHPPES